MAISIASRWRELSGEKNWEGLLDPIDSDLRRYAIHYGQRTMAVGDLLNKDNQSNGYLHSLYPEDVFFTGATLQNNNIFKYVVTHFFDIASNANESAWFGYVAVSTDEGKVGLGRRDILVAWRGTETDAEWIKNINFLQASPSELFGDDNNAKVHSGFLSLYTGTNSKTPISARQQVLKAVRELVDKYKGEEISITIVGYSLGAALATLNAMDIVANCYNKPTGSSKLPTGCMVTAFVYASPRVGNDGLKQIYDSFQDQLHILRIVNNKDVVPSLPFGIFFWPYTHLGQELKIDSSKSGFLKSQVKQPPPEDVSETIRGNTIDLAAHNLDLHLHAIALDQTGFGFEVDHDFALVNKYLDALKDFYNIPPRWWDGAKHSNMVQMDNSHWKFVPTP
ncbi:Detected protein of confused Function [Hibiscus syriacus]|uniref:Phospholipase A1 n=1 Tax=Hibiscus syriacus TaxID=106335 RepID=A0A6A3BGE0_HIBSY|nr:phospholipase A1-II 6-like [Hibiscus syriacus]KAE8715185.1 Detected protein of confused Function [Hibiscus syriacus]